MDLTRNYLRCIFCGRDIVWWREADHGRCRVNAGHATNDPSVDPRREAADREKAYRDRRVVQMRSDGMTLEAIGVEVGLSRERIRQILKRPHQMPRRRSADNRQIARLAAVDVLAVAKAPGVLEAIAEFR